MPLPARRQRACASELYEALTSSKALTLKSGVAGAALSWELDLTPDARRAMARVAESLSDHVVLTSDSGQGECPAAVFNDMQAGMDQPGAASVVINRAEAIQQALGECGHVARRDRTGHDIIGAGEYLKPSLSERFDVASELDDNKNSFAIAIRCRFGPQCRPRLLTKASLLQGLQCHLER